MNNYEKEKLTIDIVKANLYALALFIPIIVIYGIPFYLIWSEKFSFRNLINLLREINSGYILGFLQMFAILVVGVITHELIHGIVWSRFTKGGFKSIKFGVVWKMLTPYCHCKEPLLIKHYILGGIMPAIVLGIIPVIFSLINGSIWMLLLGMFFTMAAAGDFMMINILRKEKMDSLVQDHPTEVGCFVYRKNLE